MPKYETIILNESSFKYLDSTFKGEKVSNPSKYIIRSYKNSICKIDVYKNEDGYKCVFCYEPKFNIDIYRDRSVTLKKFKSTKEQLGSDETGVGDFLLPLVVVATHFKPEDLEFVKKLGLTDSKAMKDDYIHNVGKKVKEHFEHEKVVVSNEQYESLIKKGLNSKSINAICHFQCLSKLRKSNPSLPIYIDQFAKEFTFNKYLKENNLKPLNNTTFLTKGETYYPSIAVSSVLARYYLLEYKNALEKKLGINFPFGAGPLVDAAAKNIIKKLGKEESKKYMKLSFKNAQKLF